MMNQYLCRNFIAEEITSLMTISPKVKRRMGHANEYHANTSKPLQVFVADQNNFLLDEGSSSYQDWLSK